MTVKTNQHILKELDLLMTGPRRGVYFPVALIEDRVTILTCVLKLMQINEVRYPDAMLPDLSRRTTLHLVEIWKVFLWLIKSRHELLRRASETLACISAEAIPPLKTTARSCLSCFSLGLWRLFLGWKRRLLEFSAEI